jgi:hypothetical protein
VDRCSERSDRFLDPPCDPGDGSGDDHPEFVVSRPKARSALLILCRQFEELTRCDCHLARSYSSITVRTFPEGKQRNRAIAILGLVGSVSFSLGVVIGESPSTHTLQGTRRRSDSRDVNSRKAGFSRRSPGVGSSGRSPSSPSLRPAPLCSSCHAIVPSAVCRSGRSSGAWIPSGSCSRSELSSCSSSP